MDTKNRILKSALKLSKLHGYRGVTQKQIATDIGIAKSLITYHFHNMRNLQDCTLSYAIKVGAQTVIAQGLALQDPIALRLPEPIKRAAAVSIS